jgi:hypothetical protein
VDTGVRIGHSARVHADRLRPRKAAVPLLAVALIALFVVWARADVPGDCESVPIPEFNLAGVTYTARHSDDIVAQANLGDVLGTSTGDVPEGLMRCKDVKLKNGQGSLPRGSHVYSIHGIDTSIAIAVQTGSVYMKLYAP